MALPTVLSESVPHAGRRLRAGAVFSAELSSADAVLFMLATSGARDFYRGVRSDRARAMPMCCASRASSPASAALVGFLLTFVFDSVVSALTMFYSVMVVTLFAPILGGLFLPRAGRWARSRRCSWAWAHSSRRTSIPAGSAIGWAAPPFLGLIASAVTYLILAVF